MSRIVTMETLTTSHAATQQELRQSLQDAQNEAAALRAEREQMASQALEAMVAFQLGRRQGTMPADPSERIRQIDAALATNEASTRAMRVALERLDAAAAEAAAKAKTEARLAQRREARDVVRAAIPLIEHLHQLNQRLMRLYPLIGEQHPMPAIPVLYLADVDQWLLTAKRFSRGE